MTSRLVLALIVVTAANPAEVLAQRPEKPNPTYAAVLEGMICRQRQSGELDCEYRVGRSLRFVIGGVGQQDAAITFHRVDSDDEFSAGFALVHGCVVVRPVRRAADTLANIAFVSPRDGKVYRDWPSCHKATKR